MTFLPLARNSRMAAASSASAGWVALSSLSRSSASTGMRRSEAAARMASVRSHRSASARSFPRASPSARTRALPESCSTSGPSGAMTRAALFGTSGTLPRSTPNSTPNSSSSRIRCSALRSPSSPRHNPEKNERTVMMVPCSRGAARGRRRRELLTGPALELFLDARRLARQVAQIVELGAAHAAAALHRDVADRRAVGLEHALHPLAVGDLAHGKGGVQSTVALGNDHALVGLDALAVALDHLHLHYHGVTRAECGQFAGHALLVDFLNDLAHSSSPR